MWKSGLIIGAITFVLVFGMAAILSPLCAPCVTILLGLVAGYVAGVFDKPADNRAALKVGALAGAISGIGALVGQLAAGVVNGILVGPENAAAFAAKLGLPTGAGADYATTYWTMLVGMSCCTAVIDVALLALMGLVGGLIWWQMNLKKETPSP